MQRVKSLMCNNGIVFVYVIDSTYNNELKLIRLLKKLGEETFTVPVDELARETWLKFR